MPYMTVRRGQPLLAVPWIEDGEEVTRYYSDPSELRRDLAEAGRPTEHDMAGVWSDLDWEDALVSLDRIRHESRPTPPIGP